MSKEKAVLQILSNARYLDPDLPYVQVDGRIAVEQDGDTFREQTVGRIVATVVAGTPQQLTGLEAVCATYVAQKMFSGEKLKLETQVVEVILKCFLHGLQQNPPYFLPPVYTLISGLLKPEDTPEEYRNGMEALYANLPEKRKEARIRAAKLTDDLRLAREAHLQQLAK